MTGVTTWNWTDMPGNSYVQSTHGSLAFSTENTDIMYMVTNMATGGNDDDYLGDPANLEDLAILLLGLIIRHGQRTYM